MKFFKEKKLKVFVYAVVFCISVELLASYIYFQRSWEKGVATFWVAERLTQKAFPSLLKTQPKVPSQSDYEKLLSQLNNEIIEYGGVLYIMYIPTMASDSINSSERFFRDAAKKKNIPFLTLQDEMQKYPVEWLYNLPEDSHLSRLGHTLIFRYLERQFTKGEIFKRQTDNNKYISGPHPRNVDGVNQIAGRAFKLDTNSLGFRMINEINFKQPMIYILGDSFTFGTGVNTNELYSTLLNASLSSINVVNAGFPSTSIIEQYQIWRESNIQPEIVILQVLDNDVNWTE